MAGRRQLSEDRGWMWRRTQKTQTKTVYGLDVETTMWNCSEQKGVQEGNILKKGKNTLHTDTSPRMTFQMLRYILQVEKIHLEIRTNTFGNLDKYNLIFERKN